MPAYQQIQCLNLLPTKYDFSHFNQFDEWIKSLSLVMKCVFRHHDLHMFGLKLNEINIIIFTHLKLWVAVARHNFNNTTWQIKQAQHDNFNKHNMTKSKSTTCQSQKAQHDNFNKHNMTTSTSTTWQLQQAQHDNFNKHNMTTSTSTTWQLWQAQHDNFNKHNMTTSTSTTWQLQQAQHDNFNNHSMTK